MASACPHAGQSHTASASSAYVNRRLPRGDSIVPTAELTQRSTPQASHATPTTSVDPTAIARPLRPHCLVKPEKFPTVLYLPAA